MLFFSYIWTSKLQELTDSEEGHDSEENLSTNDEDSGEESGLGNTHTGSSEDEGPVLAHSQLRDKTKRSKKTVKTNKEDGSSNSNEIFTNKRKQTDVSIEPVGQKGRYLIYENLANQ